jgi:predicted nucleotidyltransferase
MRADIAEKREALATLCRRYGVTRLEVFGSAARALDFDPETSDFDFLVEFDQRIDLPSLEQLLGFAEALETLLGRPVDLVERKAVEASRNYIRRRAILREAETVYG